MRNPIKCVLLVEDNEHKARALRRALRAAFGDTTVVIHATTSDDARSVLGGMGQDVDLCVTDWDFPIKRGGPEYAGAGAEIVRLCTLTWVRVLVCSAHPAPADAPNLAEIWLSDFSADELRKKSGHRIE